MSYPRLGNALEASGDFSIEFDWERIYENETEWYKISPNKELFKINNDYYEQLFISEHGDGHSYAQFETKQAPLFDACAELLETLVRCENH